jgi:alkylation response protein AidB-like acyl-CoA dehydrogenase
MDFAFSAAEETFRGDLRSWLERELPSHRAQWPATDDEFTLHPDRSFDACLAWHKRLHAGGWVGIAWPCEYGGRGASLVEQMIFQEEMVRAGAPPGVNTIGLMLAGPGIMEWGTEAQRRRFLPRILSAEDIWCQGFSEPGAGSDLAALATRAVLDGDVFRVSGQKVWTSNAHRSQWCILLVRTDPGAPKHEGISCLLVDMKSPGITVRPLVQITGDAEFNEVFFDEVFVPDEMVVGQVNDGWRLARTTLANERVAMAHGTALGNPMEELLRTVSELDLDPAVADQLGELIRSAQVGSLLDQKIAQLILGGQDPGPQASARKLIGVRYRQALSEFRMELSDGAGVVENKEVHDFLNTRCLTIAGGTEQILLTMAGERLLGLPR